MQFMTRFAERIVIDASDNNIPITPATDQTMNYIITAVYIAIAGFAVFYLVRGSLLYITGSGNPSEVTQARTTILMAIIALVGSTLVFTMVQFVIGALS